MIILVTILVIGFFLRPKNPKTNIILSNENTISPLISISPTPTLFSKPEAIPIKFLISNFPWQSQAPQSNWDNLHNEACEEASITLVKYYLTKQKLTTEIMDQQIVSLVALQEKPASPAGRNGKKQQNLTIAETLKLAQDYFKLDGRIVNNANLTDLKNEISQGHPVIVPTAGRLLGNPNFKNPGPVYHMVVAIGYDSKNIIVQDVGTKNGEHYVYNQEIFFNAWHDWTGSDSSIEQGRKNYLVLTN